jgi:hypothetical protein
MIVIRESPWGALTPTAPWGYETPGAEELKLACQGGDRMDSWNGDHTVSRQQDLLREAGNRRLVRALRESRKASHEDRRGRKLLRFAAILARVLHKV